MSDYYNLTGFFSNHSLSGMASAANQVSDGLYGSLILLIIWTVAFVVTKSNSDTTRAAAFASFFAFIISVLLYLLGMANSLTVMLLLVLAALAGAMIR